MNTPRRHHGHLCADEDQIRERLERDRAALLAALERYMAGHTCSDKIGDQCPTLREARAALAQARNESA